MKVGSIEALEDTLNNYFVEHLKLGFNKDQRETCLHLIEYKDLLDIRLYFSVDRAVARPSRIEVFCQAFLFHDLLNIPDAVAWVKDYEEQSVL